MVELSRTVRFCLNDARSSSAAPGASLASPQHNTYAAWPAMRGLGRYYELRVRCGGEIDPTTGYFMNIKHIDRAVREQVLPDLMKWVAGPHAAPEHAPMGELMRRISSLLDPALSGAVLAVTLTLTPTYTLTLRSRAMDHLIVRQQYEFSAAHRLHVPELSDEQNREVFGKCNNPAGHGHNYQLETAVVAPIDPSGRALCVEELDAVVNEHVIRKLDHKHLNVDVPEFQDLNPSVEHIAQVIWRMLDAPMRQAGPTPGTRLEEISVWETGKTRCTYRGPES